MAWVICLAVFVFLIVITISEHRDANERAAARCKQEEWLRALRERAAIEQEEREQQKERRARNRALPEEGREIADMMERAKAAADLINSRNPPGSDWV